MRTTALLITIALTCTACRDAVGPAASAPLTSLVAGNRYSCAIDSDHHARCWGIRPGTGLVDSVPTLVAPTLTFSALSAGNEHVCGLASGGGVWCWGTGTSGQLGDGQGATSATPVAVAGLPSVVVIASGLVHTCALTAGGEAYCWGANGWGQLGNGTTSPSPVPVAVGAPTAFTALAASFGATCALTATGAAWCWGAAVVDEIGAPATDTCQDGPCALAPVTVIGNHRYVRIAAGGDHTCGLLSGGDVRCWGFNYSYELGTDATLPDCQGQCTREPTLVPGGRSMVAVAAGPHNTCAVSSDGMTWCWGSNDNNLGSALPLARYATPQRVETTIRFTGVAVGERHSCALTSTLAVYCWGNNSWGQLGDGTRTSHATPGRALL